MCLKVKVFFRLFYIQANEGKAPETMKTEPDSKAKGELYCSVKEVQMINNKAIKANRNVMKKDYVDFNLFFFAVNELKQSKTKTCSSIARRA